LGLFLVNAPLMGFIRERLYVLVFNGNEEKNNFCQLIIWDFNIFISLRLVNKALG
jgi:hypothetical protein